MKKDKYIDLLIVGYIFLVLYTMPILFVRVSGEISWKHVIKIWQDNAFLIPLFAINHWVLLPKLMHKRSYAFYAFSIIGLISVATWVCHYIDPPMPMHNQANGRPTPIPPYANMLMYAILIVGVDIGLFFSKMWHRNEQRNSELERRNKTMELELLRNQINPHFFMNTLNNIYALIDCDSAKAKVAMMKLSKIMRYILYENRGERVKLSKEFDFISNYIDLMRLRYTDDIVFTIEIPEINNDVEVPPMLFISYIENAVKHGISYQDKCEIIIKFKFIGDKLHFECINSIYSSHHAGQKGGIGLMNSQSRLSLIYGNKYDLTILDNEGQYHVSLTIPLV